MDELAKAAGAKIPADLDNPMPVSKAQLDIQQRCLQEAFARFDSAAAVGDARAEAHVRGAWILFQQGRPEDSLSWLDGADPNGDRELRFWLDLFRGRALSALGRFQESADAYRKASALYPGAQSAGIGLALQLFRLDQTTDADNVARAVRRAAGDDPWSDYSTADSRFISEHLGRLRKTIQ